jgi:hypothetical protein
MRWIAASVLLAGLFADPSSAGAWTLHHGQFAAFTGAISSTATRRYDPAGVASEHVVFNKLLFQNWMEYGLTNSVTLYAVPEYVIARSDMTGGGAAETRSESIEAGLRIRLLSDVGILSIQTSAKSAGAFDMSISSSGEAGRQLESRLLYGRNFKIFRRDAFVDLEVAKRWIARPRPDEIGLDGTAGWWITRDNELLVQCFNFMTTGAVRDPYAPYWLSKLQFSLVQRLTPHWSFQSGYFFSLGGQNIVKETGFVGSIWFRT